MHRKKSPRLTWYLNQSEFVSHITFVVTMSESCHIDGGFLNAELQTLIVDGMQSRGGNLKKFLKSVHRPGTSQV